MVCVWVCVRARGCGFVAMFRHVYKDACMSSRYIWLPNVCVCGCCVCVAVVYVALCEILATHPHKHPHAHIQMYMCVKICEGMCVYST